MFSIRTATHDDIEAVDDLLKRSYPRLLSPDYGRSLKKRAMPFIGCAQPDLVTCGTYYVGEQQGVLLGAGGWSSEPPGGGQTATGVGHIRHVVTDVHMVRQGDARSLLAHIFSAARASGIGRLQCLSTVTAVSFYKAVGFETLADVVIPLAPNVNFPAIEMYRGL